jgi:hypothetical protein
MPDLSSYKVRARKYRTLARGYAALRSKLAEPVQGATEAYEQMATRAEQGTRAEAQRNATAPSPNE